MLSNMNADKGPNASKAKKAAVAKPNSATRKEQNRNASRAYRERRKQKLALLDQLLDGDSPSSKKEGEALASPGSQSLRLEDDGALLDPASAGNPGDVAGVTAPLQDFGVLPDQLSFETSLASDNWTASIPNDMPAADLSFTNFHVGDLDLGSFDNLDPSLADATNPIFPITEATGQDAHDPVNTTTLAANPDLHLFSASFPTSLFVGDIPFSEPTPPATQPAQFSSPDTCNPQSGCSLSPHSDDGVEEILRAMPSDINLEPNPEPAPMRDVMASIARLNPLEQRRLLKRLLSKPPRDPVGEASRRDKHDLKDDARKQSSAGKRDLYPLERMRMRAEAAAAAAVEPRSFGGTITLKQMTLFAALIENTIALGLPHKHVVWEEEAASPFSADGVLVLSSSSSDSKDIASQLARARSRFKALPRDLRPVDAQLTIKHHPYIDVIPFALFRERALTAMSCTPSMLDEDELCDDLCNGAMVCWGGGGGLEMGAPWDARSWECRPWFLRKYWFLVGGREDEMWASARWWHAMRGERLDVKGGERDEWGPCR